MTIPMNIRRRALVNAMVLAAAGMAGTQMPAQAQDVPGAVAITGSVGFVSDYRLRGVSQSRGAAAVQGGITLDHASGAYAGVWASSIAGDARRGSLEMDLFAGYSRGVLPGITADVGLLYYAYPGSDGAAAGFFEPYLSLSHSYGPARFKLGANYAWAQSALAGRSHDNLYLHASADVAVPATPVTVTVHTGYQDGPLSGPAIATGSGGAGKRHGWDYGAGASATVLGRLTFGLAYSGVEGPVVRDRTDDRIVATLSAAF